jgi:hypothetical protein
MITNQINALISLIEDPDEMIFSHVRNELSNCGTDVIPRLEKEWETANHGPLFKTRIESLIQTIQFDSIRQKLEEWFKSDDQDLLEGCLIVNEIQYPANWELNEEGLMGTSLILLSPVLHKDDAFRENVNLLIQDLSSYPMTLDEYAKFSTSQIETMIEDGVLISSEKIEGELNQYQKVHYTGKQGPYNLKFMQYYFLIENNAYVLTFTTEIDQYEKYEAIGMQILDSYKFKK